ncbi:MAG: DUF2279 domain-containing protein [Bacteroidota bacterium]
MLILLSNGNILIAQGTNTDSFASDTLNRKRLKLVTITESSLYVITMTGLYSLWYQNYPQSSFHFINDNNEWLQMDKCGHVTTSYYVGLIGYSSLRWAGLEEKKAIWYGGMTGFVYLTTVEVMDGFSKEWGFSPGDLAANTLGTALFISQQLAWHEQKFVLKYSFHSSPYAQYNPDQLGSNLPQRMLKDYNGQTYWLSANISSLGLEHTGFPKWLNVAMGYGAEGMTAPSGNPAEINGIPVPYTERYRQFYLSPDIDLSRIHVKSKMLKLLLNTFGFIKIPMPAVEFNKKGVKFRPLYF